MVFSFSRLLTVLLFLHCATYCANSRKQCKENEAAVSRQRKTKRDQHGTDETKQIEELFRHHSYELSIKPSNDGEILSVGVYLMIESITDISEKDMDLTFTLFLHQTWTDKRLTFTSNRKDSLVLPSRLLEKIWVPDLYIVGSKNSFTHTTTVDNKILRLFKDGNIIYSIKITATVACQMNLHMFPFDTENCTIILRSLGYYSDEVLLHWELHDGSIIFLRPELLERMPKFQLVGHEFRSSNISTRESAKLSPESISSQLHASFIFKRHIMSVFFQSYFLPMSMVVLAGLGMWLDPRSVPARVAISVTAVLTLSTIITGIKTSLPKVLKVSYLTALDLYLCICFTYIFSTVLEFCILNYIMTKRKHARVHQMHNPMTPYELKGLEEQFKFNETYVTSIKRNATKQENAKYRICKLWNSSTKDRFYDQKHPANKNAHTDFEDCDRVASKKNCGKRGELRMKVEKIDVYFRRAYFSSYIIFNVGYWFYFIFTIC